MGRDPGRDAAAPAPEAAAQSFDLLVFSDDWGRHPSSCQHLVRELLPRHRVTWVNTVGTRRPRLDLLTLRRGREKLAAWLGARGEHRREGANPRVVDPAMWPGFGSRLGRRLNRRLLKGAVAGALADPANTIAVTTLPIVADLVGSLPLRRWVYYCVDDLSEWPGLDRDLLLRMERELLARVDAAVAVSERLAERLESLGRPAALLTHGVDPERWSGAGERAVPALEGLEEPLVVFWGVIDRRLDGEWVGALAARLERGTVVLIGPEQNPDPELARLPRVVRTGALPFEELPSVARRAAVLVMPYADLPVTRALQPLKLKEYLATGKPVVVSDLPAVAEWRDACDVASSAAELAERVAERLESGLPAAQARARARLTGESWAAKAAIFERLLAGERP